MVEAFDKQFQELYLLSHGVSLKSISMDEEPEPEPVILPPIAPVTPANAVGKKIVNPKYALVSTKSTEQISNSDRASSDRNLTDQQRTEAKGKAVPKGRVSERPSDIVEMPPSIHPGLLNLERANMFDYLPTWVEPDPEPGSEVLGYINIIDPKIKIIQMSQMNRIKVCDISQTKAQHRQMLKQKAQEGKKNMNNQTYPTSPCHLNAGSSSVHLPETPNPTGHIQEAPNPTGHIQQIPNSGGQIHDTPNLIGHNQGTPNISEHNQEDPNPTGHNQEAPNSIGDIRKTPSVTRHNHKAHNPTGHNQEAPDTTEHIPKTPNAIRHTQEACNTTGNDQEAPNATGHTPKSPDATRHNHKAPNPTGHHQEAPNTTGHTQKTPKATKHNHKAPKPTGHNQEAPNTTGHIPKTSNATRHSQDTPNTTGNNQEPPNATGQNPNPSPTKRTHRTPQSGFATLAFSEHLKQPPWTKAHEPTTNNGITPPVPKPRTVHVTDFVSQKSAPVEGEGAVSEGTQPQHLETDSASPTDKGSPSKAQDGGSHCKLTRQEAVSQKAAICPMNGVPGGEAEEEEEEAYLTLSDQGSLSGSSATHSHQHSNASSISDEYFEVRDGFGPLRRTNSDLLPNGGGDHSPYELPGLQRKLSEPHMSRGTFVSPLGSPQPVLSMSLEEAGRRRRRNNSLEETRCVLGRGRSPRALPDGYITCSSNAPQVGLSVVTFYA